MAVALLGGLLLAVGVRKRSLLGTAMAVAGGWLLYRGVRGLGRRSESGGAGAMSGWDRLDLGETAEETEVERTITVEKPADELYQFWREPAELTRIVGHFAEVGPAGEDRLHWTIAGPLGQKMEWETEIVEDRPGEFLQWESVEDSGLLDGWSVRFRSAPNDRGTEVTLHLRFDPPGGQYGRKAMELLDVVPSTVASKALRRFKSLAETGEIPTLERNPSGRGSGDLI